VSTPMTTSTTSRRSVRLVMRSLLRRMGRGSGPGRRFRQDCDETRQALLTPGGQAPDQASSSNRAGAGDHERTSRSRARSQSHRGSHSWSPTTAQHHQAVKAIVTVTPPTRTHSDCGYPSRHRATLAGDGGSSCEKKTGSILAEHFGEFSGT
jgi:hypothetical protein